MNPSQDAALPATLPLFPLGNVLFPDGRMKMRIFEARFVDMIARCMQGNRNFGVCLAEGEGQSTHAVGVEARIVDWDMSQPDQLGLTVRGERRFRIIEQQLAPEGFPVAAVEWLGTPESHPVPETYADILPLLQAVAGDAKNKSVAPPFRFGDADWVGFRYAEFLPIPPLARQRLLELEDADMRLSIIRQFLQARGLL